MIRGQVPDQLSPTQVITGVPQLSVAVTVPMFAAGTAVMHSTVMSAGQVIDGGVLSSTVSVCTQGAVLPQLSSAW